ncbi:MAG: PAS domain S-box protein [Methanoregula sp.]|jgi:PAS domain S-box-containing protein|nr:PAS domain S-box protein [Methanoregula sp.]
MRKAGPAKVYTLSTRLPADRIFSQSSDLILVLDETYTVRNVNDSFLLAFGTSKDTIENLDINTTSIGPGLIDRIRDSVKQGMAGKESVANAWVPVQKDWRAFRVRVIPLVFGWGEKGVVILLEDRTGEIMAQEENALLADLVNASPAAVTVSDFTGNFLYSNKKNLDLHGYSLREFLDLNLGQLDNPASAKLMTGRLEDLKKSGEISFETVHFRKDGREIPLEVHSTIARWGDRDVVVGIATDISERKRAEQALRESERRFADIIDFLPDATLVINREGTVIAWNRAIEEMTGVKAVDIVGTGGYAYAVAIYGERRPILLDLVFRDDPAVREHYHHFRKEGSTITAETVLTSPGGRERVVWLKASPFYEKDGRITGAIESIRDITEWRRVEEELRDNYDLLSQKELVLRESEETFRAMVEQSGDGIIIVDFSGIVQFANSRARDIIRYPSERSTTQINVFDIISPELRGNAVRDFLQVSRGIDSYEVNYKVITCEKKERWVECIGKKISFKGSPAMLLSFRDVTVRKATESAFQAMVTGMVGTTGMDSLDRITESISEWLGADCVMIGEIAPDGNHVKVLSMLLDGKKIPDYSYILKGTPCENTAESGFCVYPDDVQNLFPESSDLHAFNIRGYAGTPLRNFEGQAVGILCVLTRNPLILPPSAREIFDIIAVKAAAEIGRRNSLEALHESESKFRTIFENSPYPVAINSYPDNKFLEVNAAFLASSGYTEAEILGKNPVELGLFSLTDLARLMGRMAATGRLENVPLAMTGKGGRRIHVQFSASPVTINDRRATVTVAAEVTRLKRVEEELHRQNLVLETINRLAIEFASLPRGKSVPEHAVKSLMKLTGAVATLFTIYDPSDRTLQVTNFDIAPGMLEKVIRLLGKQPGDVKSPVSTDVYQEMVGSIIGRRKTLTEASFGQIPPLVSSSIQKLLNIDRFIGIAYVIEGNLYGTSVLAMKPGQPDPSTELMESFAHIVAISLRRDRDERGS